MSVTLLSTNPAPVLEPHLKDIADAISQQFFDHDWNPDYPNVLKTMAGRIINSIVAMEKAGYNGTVPGKQDWISAINSERFKAGQETVARILAYPDEPGKGGEVLKLLRELGIPDEDQKKHSLNCGAYFSHIPEDQQERDLWGYAAGITLMVRKKSE